MRSIFSLVVLALQLSPVLVHARDEILFTSSITYCAPPQVLVVQEFDITYFNNNQSVAFALSATNLADNLNASANIQLNAYGLTPFNYTFDLCNVLEGELCPLPQYNVTGSALLPLPSAVQLPIPNIAFKIPDLEAVAQLTLRRVEDGEVAVCIQSTLSNGWSLHIPAVSAATAAFALLSFLSSFFNSFRHPASSPAVFRTITTFSYFQYIAMTGMLHLNYPLTYIAFSTNFAWSFGLFSGSTAIQNSIQRMREKTGSRLSGDSQAPSSYSDRTLSPYNLMEKAEDNPKTIDIGSFVGSTTQSQASNSQQVSPATITSTSETLEPGIPVYVNQMNVATGNAFMTTFFTILFFLLAFTVFLVSVIVALRILKRYRPNWASKRQAELRPVLLSSGLRLTQIFILPVLIFTFFQWSLHDNWLSTFISVITFLVILLAFLYSTYLIFRIVISHGANELEEPKHQQRFGALIGPFRPSRYYFFTSTLLISFIRACFVSFDKHNGFIQVIGLLVLEVFYFAALVVMRPGHTRRSDVLEIFLSLTRVVSTGLLIPFTREKLSVAPIPRVAIGIVIAVILCVGVIVIAINVLLDLLPVQMAWSHVKRQRKDSASSSDQSEKEIEEGEATKRESDPSLSVLHSQPPLINNSSSSSGNILDKALPDSPASKSPKDSAFTT